MNAKTASQRVFYRNKVSNFLVWMLTTLGALYFLAETVEAVEESEGSVVLIGFSALLMMSFLIPALRESFHGVVVTGSQVRIRNIMRSHVLGWDEIERFELARYNPWPKVGVAVLESGRRVPMTGVQFALATRFAQDTVVALNTRLAAMRGRDFQTGRAGEHSSERSNPSASVS
jgi:Bacterial PH domain